MIRWSWRCTSTFSLINASFLNLSDFLMDLPSNFYRKKNKNYPTEKIISFSSPQVYKNQLQMSCKIIKSYDAHCSKITKIVAFDFLIRAFSTNCPNESDPSGNTVWPQAVVLQKFAKLTIFGTFNELLFTQKFARNFE